LPWNPQALQPHRFATDHWRSVWVEKERECRVGMQPRDAEHTKEKCNGMGSSMEQSGTCMMERIHSMKAEG